MSSNGTSRPNSAKASRAAATTRCRLRSASTRSPGPSAVRGAGVEVIRITIGEVEAPVHLSATVVRSQWRQASTSCEEDAMRAVVVAEHGAEPALTEVPVPQAGAGEVLVKVQASSIN